MKIFLVELEPVETRYTAQWQKYLPVQLSQAGFDVHVIRGPVDTPQDTTPGAFLNFSGTNYWKSEQLKTISKMFADGKIQDGDYFLYTDAWNPTVIQLKYMAELLGINIKIGGLWHAGSYDPQDFLGRMIGNKPWVRSAEHSMFSCYDHNFYATDFHIDLFAEQFFDWVGEELKQNNRTVQRVGWPMEYLNYELVPTNEPKENIIVFPHRLAPEKQLEIFQDLSTHLPQYEFVVCQEQNLTKSQYHSLLNRAKIVFSANLQETLGISWYEGVMMNCIPFVPDRLSYSEMALDMFKYPSEWTKDFDSYQQHRFQLMQKIMYMMQNYEWIKESIRAQKQKLCEEYFSGQALYEVIRSHNHAHQ